MYDDLIKRLRINGAGNPKNIFDEAADAIEKLSADLDAAVDDLKKECYLPYSRCKLCKNRSPDICKGCIRDDLWADIDENPKDLWEWRGRKKEDSE